MKTNHYLTTEERERILDTLSEEQKEFLLNNVKQRVRSKFANAVAMDEWELVDYVDAGHVNPDLRCECGRSLRYQYVIKDLRTEEIKKLGSTHFELHTGIPTKIAKEVVKGVQEINFELDEILEKVRRKWKVPQKILDGIQQIQVSEEIQIFLQLGLPLLDKDMTKLSKYMKETERENIIKDYTRRQKEPLNAKRAELRRKLPSLHVAQRTLPQKIKDGLMRMIADNEVINARELSEEAIKLGTVDNRYSTGKPIIYPEICIFLDLLCTNGELELLMEQSDVENRVYQKLSK